MALKAGTAAIEITPPVGVELCGYGVYLQRRSTGVLDPLRARALVLDSGGVQMAIVSCDLIALMDRTVAEARQLIEGQTGIPGEHVLLGCSHTHAGPVTVELRGWGEPEPEYVAILPKYLAGVVSMAVRALQPARLGTAVGEVPGMGVNRVEGDQGPLDTGVSVLRVESAQGAPLATVYCLSAHGVSHLPTNTLVSADWIGVASGLIEQTVGGQGLFVQGSCGDVNPALVHTGKYVEAGTLAGERVAKLVGGIKCGDEVAIEVATRRVALPLNVTPVDELERAAGEARAKLASLPPGPETFSQWAMARFELDWALEALMMHQRGLREELRSELQAIRLGEALILAHGGELFCEFGIELKRRFAPRPTFVVGYANGFIGYVPDPEDFARGGYAAAMVPKICNNFPFAADVGERVVSGLSDLAAGVGA